jgi:hypothetical protein
MSIRPIVILAATLAICQPAKAETPKTAVLECEMEWIANGEQYRQRVSVQIDFKAKRLFVGDWQSEGFGIWDMHDGKIKFSVGKAENEWFGHLDRVTGEGFVWGKSIPTHRFRCKETKAVF